MAGGKGFSVFVNIGATVASSVGASATAVERRIGAMGKALKVQAAESKIYAREMSASYKNMAGLFIGGGSYAALHKSFGAYAEYQHQISALAVQGRTATEVAQAISAAHKTMADVPTSTLSDNLKIINETTLAYGGMAHAIDNLSFNQKLGAMMKNIMPGGGGDSGEMFANLTKALEIRSGKLSKVDYQRQASGIFRAISVSGGRVNPENFLGFMQQANPGARAYSEEFMTTVVPSLIQEFGGERAGTLSSAFTTQMMGRVGQGGKRIVENWKKYHLLKPGSGAGNNLSRSGWNPKDVIGLDLALSNQMEYFEKIVIPHLTAPGPNRVDLNDPKQVLVAAQGLFGRATGARIASTYLDPKQLSRLHADQGLYGKAMGPDAAFTQAMANDPTLAMASAASSLKNLEINIGKAISPEVILALQNFAKGINFLAAEIDKHPLLGKAIGGLMAAIVGITGFKLAKSALGFLGFGKMFSAGFKMLMGAGIVGTRGPMLPLVTRIGAALRILLVGLGSVIGDGLLGALAIGLEILAGPVGWVILAASAIALVWTFRKQIESAWHVVAEWFGTAFDFIKARVLSMDWASIGWAIADGMTLGLTSGLHGGAPAIGNAVKAAVTALGQPSRNPATSGDDHIFGMRAAGGSVSRGHAYGINERGGEMFVPGRSGTIVNAGATAALIAALSGGLPSAVAARPAALSFGDINVYEAHDAQATARAVRAELKRLASQQSSYLSD